MKIPINIIGGAYAGRSIGNRQECINLFPIVDQTGAKSPTSLMTTPGLRFLTYLGKNAEVRGLHVMSGELYAVCGNTLFKLDRDNKSVELGTIGSSAGVVTMADNGEGGQLAICDGSRLYIYADDKITDVRPASSMAYQNRYLIITEPGESIIRHSKDGGNLLEWDDKDWIAADGAPDMAVAVLSDHNEVWIFGEESTEVFYKSNGEPLFAPLAGGFIESGCGAPLSPAKADNSVFWIDNHGMVIRAAGYAPAIISTESISARIRALGDWHRAIGYTHVMEGHTFYVLTFPGDDLTLVYDMATGVWYQWSSGLKKGRHRSNCITSYKGKIIVGDFENGKLYTLDMDFFHDDQEQIRRVRTTQPVRSQSGNHLIYHSFELSCRVGEGLPYGQGDDPKIMLQWSDTDGRTWSNEKTKSLGKMGRWKTTVKWPRLGRAKNRIFRIALTDPIPFEILEAWADVTECDR